MTSTKAAIANTRSPLEPGAVLLPHVLLKVLQTKSSIWAHIASLPPELAQEILSYVVVETSQPVCAQNTTALFDQIFRKLEHIPGNLASIALDAYVEVNVFKFSQHCPHYTETPETPLLLARHSPLNRDVFKFFPRIRHAELELLIICSKSKPVHGTVLNSVQQQILGSATMLPGLVSLTITLHCYQYTAHQLYQDVHRTSSEHRPRAQKPKRWQYQYSRYIDSIDRQVAEAVASGVVSFIKKLKVPTVISNLVHPQKISRRTAGYYFPSSSAYSRAASQVRTVPSVHYVDGRDFSAAEVLSCLRLADPVQIVAKGTDQTMQELTS